MHPRFESMWRSIEKVTQEVPEEPTISKMFQQLSSEERSSVRASQMVTVGKRFFEQVARWRCSAVKEIAIAQHVIPNGDALDKILRYEGAIERQLGRAVDRLERLQRRRKGEAPSSACERTFDARIGEAPGLRDNAVFAKRSQ